MAPLPHQSPLVYDPSWRAAPLNSGMHSQVQSSAQHHLHHIFYESPFQRVQVGAGLPESALHGLTRVLAPIDAFLGRHPSVLLLTRLACLLSFLVLLSFSLWDLYARSSRRRRRQRLTREDVERVRLDAFCPEKAGSDAPQVDGRMALVARGLRPGSLYRVTNELVFLVPEAADHQVPRGGCFLVAAED